jgi:hypothetical protein
MTGSYPSAFGRFQAQAEVVAGMLRCALFTRPDIERLVARICLLLRIVVLHTIAGFAAACRKGPSWDLSGPQNSECVKDRSIARWTKHG